MTDKPWYTSKTVWVNLILVILSIAAYVLQGIGSGDLPVNIDGEVVLFFSGVVNLFLRFMSNQGLK